MQLIPHIDKLSFNNKIIPVYYLPKASFKVEAFLNEDDFDVIYLGLTDDYIGNSSSS